MSRGLNYACVNSSYHSNHSSYCVLFYLIVLYGCVCQPLINGYDDDDGIDLGGCEDCCNVRRRLRTFGSSSLPPASSASATAAASAATCRKRAMDECSADCSTTDELQDDVMHKVHIQLHSGQDAIRIQVSVLACLRVLCT